LKKPLPTFRRPDCHSQTSNMLPATPTKIRGVLSAIDLLAAGNGTWVTVAGVLLIRQGPGTGKGFLFVTLEDETGSPT
jgi:hypothetical protein